MAPCYRQRTFVTTGQSPTSTGKEYLPTPGGVLTIRDSSGGLDYDVTDLLGTPVANLNLASGVLGESLATPYGQNRYTANASGPGGMQTAKGFTGQYQDTSMPGSSQLDYFNARYYDPVIGRFSSADDFRTLGDPCTMDPYSYVDGHVESATDPSGHCLQWFPRRSGKQWVEWGLILINGVLSLLGGSPIPHDRQLDNLLPTSPPTQQVQPPPNTGTSRPTISGDGGGPCPPSGGRRRPRPDHGGGGHGAANHVPGPGTPDPDADVRNVSMKATSVNKWELLLETIARAAFSQKVKLSTAAPCDECMLKPSLQRLAPLADQAPYAPAVEGTLRPYLQRLVPLTNQMYQPYEVPNASQVSLPGWVSWIIGIGIGVGFFVSKVGGGGAVPDPAYNPDMLRDWKYNQEPVGAPAGGGGGGEIRDDM